MKNKMLLCGLLTFAMLICGCSKQPPKVKIETSMGDIIVELNPQAAPVTVENFLKYVKDGFYDGTIFHRVIQNFMIQAGGIDQNMSQKGTYPAIINEASNGLKNERGTIAMGRTSNPNSATSHFFINQINNTGLDYSAANPGYAVFGKVLEGMDVVDKIAAVKTTTLANGMENVPVEPVIIKSITVVAP